MTIDQRPRSKLRGITKLKETPLISHPTGKTLILLTLEEIKSVSESGSDKLPGKKERILEPSLQYPLCLFLTARYCGRQAAILWEQRLAATPSLVLDHANTVMYAEAILDAGGGGRVVPGWSPCSTRSTLPSAKNARSYRDGAAPGVLRRCADEESALRLSIVGAPCTTPGGAPTYVTVFT